MTAHQQTKKTRRLLSSCLMSILLTGNLNLLAGSSVLISPASAAPVQVPASIPAIKMERDAFIVNGQPMLLHGGSVQWFRLPESAWEDRILKFKAAGFNTIELYVAWSLHEPREGIFDFKTHDLKKFLDLVVRHGLFVYFRPGPYITNEMDGGGVPGWLTAKASKQAIDPDRLDGKINLRTPDADYLWYVERYLRRLNEVIAPYLATAGGPILLYAVENEHNWFQLFFQLDKYSRLDGRPERPLNQELDSRLYLERLKSMVTAHGIDVPIVTCPGEPDLESLHGAGLYALPNMYGGALKNPEYHASRLKEQTIQPSRPPQPTGITETDRFANLLRRLILGGMDSVFHFNIAGYHQEGRMNGMVLNVPPPGSAKDLFEAFKRLFKPEFGAAPIPVPIGYFHNVMDFYGTISPSGLLRPSFHDFRRTNLFLQSFGSIIAAAGSSHRTHAAIPKKWETAKKLHLGKNSDTTKSLAPPIAVTVTAHHHLGITDPDGIHGAHYWLPAAGGAMLLGLFNPGTGPAALNSGDIKVGDLKFPQKTTLTIAPRHSELGPRASASEREYTHLVPMHFPLRDGLQLAYSTSEILALAPAGRQDILILYGSRDSQGEALFNGNDLKLASLTPAVNAVLDRNQVILDFPNRFGEAFEISYLDSAGIRRHLQVLLADREMAGRMWILPDPPYVLAGPELMLPASTPGNWRLTVDPSSKVWHGVAPAIYVLNGVKDGGRAAASLPPQPTASAGLGLYSRMPVPDLLFPASGDFSYSLDQGRTIAEAEPGLAQLQQRSDWITSGDEAIALEDLGILTGHAWYQGEFFLKNLPLLGNPRLRIDSVSDFAGIYLNGRYLLTVNPLGTVVDSKAANHAYRFKVDKNLLQVGRNTIEIRNEIWGRGSVAWPLGRLGALPIPGTGHSMSLPLAGFSLPAISYDSRKGVRGKATVAGAPVKSWKVLGGLRGEGRWTVPQGFDAGQAEAASLPLRLQPGAMTWYQATFSQTDLNGGHVPPDRPLVLSLRGKAAKATLYLNGRLIGRWLSDDGWLSRGNWGQVSRGAWMNTDPDDFPIDAGLLATTLEGENEVTLLIEDASDQTAGGPTGILNSLELRPARENKAWNGASVQFQASPPTQVTFDWRYQAGP